MPLLARRDALWLRTRSLRSLGPALVALLLLARPAPAGDLRLPATRDELGQGIELTPWLRLSPHLRQAVYYTNNVLFEPGRSRDEDVVSVTSLGLDLAADGRGKKASLGYAFSYLHYFDNEDLSTTEHRVRAAAQLELGRLTADLSGSVARFVTPTDPRFVGQVRRWVGQAGLRLDWEHNDLLGARLEGALDAIDFSERELDFFDQLGWGVNGYVTWSPALPLKLLAGGGYRELLYTNGDAVAPDLALYNASLGLDARLPARLDGELRLGWEQGRILDRRDNPRSIDPPDGLLTSAQLRWTPKLNKLHETAILVFGLHRISFSSNSLFLRLTRVGLQANQALPFDLAVTGEVSYEVQEPEDAHHLRSIASLLGLTWSPSPVVSLGLQGGYIVRRSADGNFEVLTATAALTLRY